MSNRRNIQTLLCLSWLLVPLTIASQGSANDVIDSLGTRRDVIAAQAPTSNEAITSASTAADVTSDVTTQTNYDEEGSILRKILHCDLQNFHVSSSAARHVTVARGGSVALQTSDLFIADDVDALIRAHLPGLTSDAQTMEDAVTCLVRVKENEAMNELLGELRPKV